jgi:hypothetical protein
MSKGAQAPRGGPSRIPCVMHFYSGLPTHFLSGVDTPAEGLFQRDRHYIAMLYPEG